MAITIILTILSFYLLAKASEANQRKRAAKRAEAERARRQAEIKRIQEEQRKAEQERQAEQIAKQEIRLKALEQKLQLARRDEEHWNGELEAVLIDAAGIEAYVNYMKRKGLPCSAKENELKKLQSKAYTLETKALKARQTRELCEMQMQAA